MRYKVYGIGSITQWGDIQRDGWMGHLFFSLLTAPRELSESVLRRAFPVAWASWAFKLSAVNSENDITKKQKSLKPNLSGHVGHLPQNKRRNPQHQRPQPLPALPLYWGQWRPIVVRHCLESSLHSLDALLFHN